MFTRFSLLPQVRRHLSRLLIFGSKSYVIDLKFNFDIQLEDLFQMVQKALEGNKENGSLQMVIDSIYSSETKLFFFLMFSGI